MKPFIHPFGNENISLRLLKEDDLELILSWRNRDDARKWFNDSSIISIDQHRKWFEKYIDKKDDLHFIVEAKKTPVGQLAVYHMHWEKRVAEIGRFLVAPHQERKGYMRQACAELIKFCRYDLKLLYLFLEVMVTNDKAIALYKKNGFSEEVICDTLMCMGQSLKGYIHNNG